METHFRDPSQVTAAQIMSSPVVACREETRLEEIAETLGDHRFSGLAVVDANSRLVGMISERDIAHALGGPLLRLAIRRPGRDGDSDRRFPMEGRTVRDAMSTPPVVAHPGTTLRSLAHVMWEKQVNRVPILDGDDLVGIVTRGDVLRGVGGLALHEPPPVQAPVVVGSGIAGARLTHPDD